MKIDNPLQLIINWLNSIEDIYLIDLISLAAHFHDDPTIERERESKVKKDRFLLSIAPNHYNKLDTVKRALFIIKLIDFSLTGRDTEDGWTEVLDRLLSMRSIAQEKQINSDLIDKNLHSFQERKEKWIAIGESWHALVSTTLTNRNIADWYFLDDDKE